MKNVTIFAPAKIFRNKILKNSFPKTTSCFLQKFQRVCYAIEERQELLNSINNFLDETVVLPPGDWDKKILLSMSEIHELKNKKRLRLEAMEKLKQAKEISKKMSVVGFTVETKPEVTDEKAELEKAEKEEEEKKRPKRMDDPLVRTSVPFGGVINELKKRFPQYKSDITDAFRNRFHKHFVKYCEP